MKIIVIEKGCVYMSYSLSTIELLKILDENPTYRGINKYGHILRVRGTTKEIIHKKIKNTSRTNKHVTLSDRWRVVKPIEYDVAKELFSRFRSIEVRFKDGSKKIFRKTNYNAHVIIESQLPDLKDVLYYCLSYAEGE